MAIKVRAFHFKSGDPYAGGPCILEDRSVAWAAMSDEDDGEGRKVAKLILLPLPVEDRRPASVETYRATRGPHHAKRRT